MASIFKDMSLFPSFWQATALLRPKHNQVLMSGLLYQGEKALGPGKAEFFMLTKLALLQTAGPTPDSPVIKEAGIRWVTVLPFTEYIENEIRFGFSIKCRDEKLDFYVESEDDLEGWIRGFEKTSVLQDIEDDYSIGEVLGSGGQSIVYVGVDLDSGKKVAVKAFDKQLLRESERRFLALIHEIEVLRDFSHHRVVTLYRVYESLTHIQLVMEYIPGQELFQCLSLNGAFTEQEARSFMMNLLEVLKCMEENNVVHRDLKPENIILTDPTDKSEFKIIDFGFATKHMGKELLDTCGSPGYVAPEIILKHKHGPSVDIYSSGVIFYILLCGYSPFYSTKKSEVIKKNAKNEISFTGVWNSIDHNLVRMIKAMTNFNAKMRTTAPELMNFLAGRSSAVDQMMRRGSAIITDSLPPLLKGGATPRSPNPARPKGSAASPSIFSKMVLKVPQPGASRWANLQ